VRLAIDRVAASLVLVLSLAAASVVVPATPTDAAPTRTAEERAIEARLFDGHGRARTDPASFGYGSMGTRDTFRWAEDIAETARAWSDTMAREGRMYHNPRYASQTCCWRSVGENVAYLGPISHFGGNTASADRLMTMWMDSTGHRNNIMRAEFTQVGIGVSVDARGYAWATAVFRAPSASAPGGSTSYPGDGSATPPAPGGPLPTIRDTGSACPATVTSAGFRDVAGGEQQRAVNCLKAWGVTGGTTPTTYSPTNLVRRDQMASFIARAVENSGGTLPPATRHHFTDVPSNSPHADAINRLAEVGVIGGYADGTFGPLRTVTRAQMAKFLVEGFEHRTGDQLPAPSRRWFSDVAGGALATNIDQMADAGWAGGRTDGTYQPSNGVRRDHMAYFVTRWLAHLVDSGHAAGL
jgi:uncharacterized protein YkwD